MQQELCVLLGRSMVITFGYDLSLVGVLLFQQELFKVIVIMIYYISAAAAAAATFSDFHSVHQCN